MTSFVIPGLIDCDSLNINDNLLLNGVSGTSGQIVTKTGATTQSWQTPYQNTLIKYVASFAAQDLNSVVGPSPAVFSVAPLYNVAVTSRGSVVGISQPNTTQFLIGTSGQYGIDVSGFIDPTSTGPISSVVTLSLEIGGIELATGCIVVNTFSFTGSFPPINIIAGLTVRILCRRVIGGGTFNTFASPTIVPNFMSTTTFTLINTLNP
jgi:hypothetical protein